MSAPPTADTPERILQRLDWQVIRRLDGMLQGDYRSLFRGHGVDFADLREYQPQDDIRHIDWNVTARMETPYVRQYAEDREITAWFLLDLSPSMDFGAQHSLKRSILTDFVTTFARLLTRHGNRVGAVLYSSQVTQTIPARGGRLQVLRLLNDLLKQPKLAKALFTSLGPLLETGLRMIGGARWYSSYPISLARRAGNSRCGCWASATIPCACACGIRASASCPMLGQLLWKMPKPASSCMSIRTTSIFASATRRRSSSARLRFSKHLRGRASIPWRSRPKMTWCARLCALRPCGGGERYS